MAEELSDHVRMIKWAPAMQVISPLDPGRWKTQQHQIRYPPARGAFTIAYMCFWPHLVCSLLDSAYGPKEEASALLGAGVVVGNHEVETCGPPPPQCT